MAKGVLCVLVEPGYDSSTWFTKSYAGLKTGAAKRDVTIERLRGVADLARYQDVGSAILMGARTDWARYMITALRKHGVKSVLLGASPQDFGGDVSGVELDRRSLVERMVEYFCHCGRMRLACLGNKPQDINDEMRKLAFLRAARRRGLSVTESDVYGGNIVSAIDRLLDRVELYDGVVCVNDQTAVLLLEAAAQRGVRVPEDLFVSGSGDCIIGALTTPSLTTSTLDYFEMGVQSVSVWHYLERNPGIDAVCVTIPCQIICRGSTNFLPVPDADAELLTMSSAAERREDDALRTLDRLENCLLRCDALDFGILRGILAGDSMEKIAAELFVAQGTVSYRVKKLYRAMGVDNRRSFLSVVSPYVSNAQFLEGQMPVK